MKILYVASEMVPYCKSGGLADVAGAFPSALARQGVEVRTVLPWYEAMFEASGALLRQPFHVHVASQAVQGELYRETDSSGVDRYLVRQPHYYDRNGIYGDQYGDFGDNDERFAYLCEAALLMCKFEGWQPDVIHANDWQAGIMGPLLRLKYGNDPFFAQTRLVFTIHNLAFQGWFSGECYRKFNLPDSVMRFDGMEMNGGASYMKAGLQYSDFITTVSPTYAREILGKEFGCGMEGILQARADRLAGILNGVDLHQWSPATDPYLEPYNFHADELEPKEKLKGAFLESIGLPYWPHVPLIGMVSRFAAQKGISLVESALEEALAYGVQIVILGSGDPGFSRSLKELEDRYPRQVRAFIKYDNTLAHRIEAASDYFWMPSRYEPCGLNQMYSLLYGTIPIVYHTGGLADTVFDCDLHPAHGNGYSFFEYSRGAFLDATRRALGLFDYPEIRYSVQRRGMSADFSWDRSATMYTRLYQALVDERNRG